MAEIIISEPDPIKVVLGDKHFEIKTVTSDTLNALGKMKDVNDQVAVLLGVDRSAIEGIDVRVLGKFVKRIEKVLLADEDSKAVPPPAGAGS